VEATTLATASPVCFNIHRAAGPSLQCELLFGSPQLAPDDWQQGSTTVRNSFTGRLGRQPKASYRSVAVARSRWSLDSVHKFTIYQVSGTVLLFLVSLSAAAAAA
jgi:hypothetical protein